MNRTWLSSNKNSNSKLPVNFCCTISLNFLTKFQFMTQHSSLQRFHLIHPNLVFECLSYLFIHQPFFFLDNLVSRSCRGKKKLSNTQNWMTNKKKKLKRPIGVAVASLSHKCSLFLLFTHITWNYRAWWGLISLCVA